jgi:tonB-dependent receptor plug domain./tonB dependent receptor
VRIARCDYIQLRDVSLGYSIPKSLLTKSFLSSVDLKLQASNLFLIYSDKKLNGALPYAYTPHSLIFTCTVGM